MTDEQIKTKITNILSVCFSLSKESIPGLAEQLLQLFKSMLSKELKSQREGRK